MIAKDKSIFVGTITKVKGISKNYLIILVVIISALIRLLFLNDIPLSLYTHETRAVYIPYLYLRGVINLALRDIVYFVFQGTFASYIFGPSNFMARLPVAIYGILLVIITYKLSNEMFGERIGLLSSMLIALSPWAIIFSRHQTQSSAVAFYFTFLIFLMYKGTKSNEPKKKITYYGISSIIFGLLIILRSFNLPFALLLVTGYFLIFSSMKKFEWKKICYFGLITALLIAWFFYLYSSQYTLVHYAYTHFTYYHAESWPEFIKLALERFCLHLSPDFLVFTGGYSFAGTEGFQQMISTDALLIYSTGTVGMLNYWGILIYPAIFYLIYQVLKKKSIREEKLLLWWITAYALASGVAYYDNPNAARNIFGLPALVIAISLFVNRAYYFIKHHVNQTLTILFLSGIAVSTLAPTAYFLNDYFGSYSIRSAKSYDYGLREVAQFLSEENLVERPIYLYNLYARDYTLAFYSPRQPTNPSRFALLPPTFNLSNLYPKKAWIQITRPLNFGEGVIEWKTKLIKGYGDASCAYIQFLSDENNLLGLTVYADDSTYNPSTYLLYQKISGEYYFQFKGRPQLRSLNRSLEYNIWYTIRLEIASDIIAFYLNGDLITTWLRPSSGKYTALRLGGYSASVCFTALKINGTEINLSSDWKTLSGIWTTGQELLCGDASKILIIRGSDMQTFLDSDIDHKILRIIYNPDGSIAFAIISIP